MRPLINSIITLWVRENYHGVSPRLINDSRSVLRKVLRRKEIIFPTNSQKHLILFECEYQVINSKGRKSSESDPRPNRRARRQLEDGGR